MLTLAIALVAGALLGLSLGALGGGGSILAVPVLVYLLDQSPAQATTGSLVVVGVTALIAATTAHREGNVLLGRGVAFGVVAIGGAALGAVAASHVSEAVLMASFAALMLVVGGVMVTRQVRSRRRASAPAHHRDRTPEAVGVGAGGASSDFAPREERPRPRIDDPIITFRPEFFCACPRALKVLVTATVVGLLTGFLGVGGGFLVVPALLLALALPMQYAAGTSLVVITLTSASALLVRAGSGTSPDWGLVAALTVASAVAAVVGAKLASRIDTDRLSMAFTGLVLAVAVYTASQALPALL